MANPEQGSTPGRNNAKRLVFDEKQGKWRMISLAPVRKEAQPPPHTGSLSTKGDPHRGHPISQEHAQSRDEGLKQYWQKLLQDGNTLLYQQHTDKISDGVKSWWHQRKQQQQ